MVQRFKIILINVLPANRPALLSDKNDIPTGPTVATSTGKVSQNATYQDLLKLQRMKLILKILQLLN